MTFDIIALVNIVLTLFFLVVAGFVSRKLGFINDTLSKGFSNFVIYVCQPFLIFSSILGVEYSLENLKNGGMLFLIICLAQTVMGLLAFFLVRWIKEPTERNISEYAVIFSNVGFMGMPLYEVTFGPIGRFYGAIYIIVFNLLTWSYGLMVLGRKVPTVKLNVRKIFLNVGTVPSVIGILLYVLRVPVPVSVLDAVDYLGSLCTPMSMIIIGSLIATIPMKKLFCDVKIYFVSIARLIVMPIVVTLVLSLFGLPRELVLFCGFVASLPSPTNVATFGEVFDLSPKYAASIVGVSTILSVITVPLIFKLITSFVY